MPIIQRTELTAAGSKFIAVVNSRFPDADIKVAEVKVSAEQRAVGKDTTQIIVTGDFTPRRPGESANDFARRVYPINEPGKPPIKSASQLRDEIIEAMWKNEVQVFHISKKNFLRCCGPHFLENPFNLSGLNIDGIRNNAHRDRIIAFQGALNSFLAKNGIDKNLFTVTARRDKKYDRPIDGDHTKSATVEQTYYEGLVVIIDIKEEENQGNLEAPEELKLKLELIGEEIQKVCGEKVSVRFDYPKVSSSSTLTTLETETPIPTPMPA